MSHHKTILLSILFASITGGFVAFASALYFFNTQQSILPTDTETPERVKITTDTNPDTKQHSPTTDQIAQLEASVSSLLSRVAQLENAPQINQPLQAPTQTSFQRQVIYIGSAESHHREWTNTGLEVELDSADYPQNAQATFEAGLSIIGGEAWARLVNKTTGAVINISEISHNNSTTTWKTSPHFKLHTGNYTYQVQLRSTSGEKVTLSGARVIIDN